MKEFKKGIMFIFGMIAALFVIAVALGLGNAIAIGLFEIIKPFLKH